MLQLPIVSVTGRARNIGYYGNHRPNVLRIYARYSQAQDLFTTRLQGGLFSALLVFSLFHFISCSIPFPIPTREKRKENYDQVISQACFLNNDKEYS